MLPYSKPKIIQFKSVQLENPQRRRPHRNAITRREVPNQPSTGDDLLLSQQKTKLAPHQMDLSTALLSHKVNMMLGRGESYVNLKNTHGEHQVGGLGLQSTLQRNSMDQDPHSMNAIQMQHQSSFAIGTHNASRDLNGGSSQQQHNTGQGFMIPTMQLDVDLEGQSQSFRTKRFSSKTQLLNKHASGASNSSVGALTSVAEAAGMPINPSETYQIDLVRPTAMSPKMVGITRAQTQMHNSHTVQQQTQGEILDDIQKQFEQLKKLFPVQHSRVSAKALSQKSRRPIGALIAGNRACSSVLKSSRPTTSKPLQANTMMMAQIQSTSRVVGDYQSSKFQNMRNPSRTTGNTQTSLLTSDMVANKRLNQMLKIQESSFPQRQIKSNSRQSVRRLLSRKNIVNISSMLQQEQSSPPKRSANSLERSPSNFQQNQVAVLQLDSQQLLNNVSGHQSSTTMHQKKVIALLPPKKQISRLIAHQGPIKRLKSAMIRSVFDKGDENYNHPGLHLNSKQVLKRQRRKLSQLKPDKVIENSGLKLVSSYNNSDDDQMQIASMLLSTKAQQLALPTYTMTTPLIQDYNSEHSVIMGSHGSHINQQNQIFFNHQSQLNDQMAAASRDYEQYLNHQQQMLSANFTADNNSPAFFYNMEATDYSQVIQNPDHNHTASGLKLSDSFKMMQGLESFGPSDQQIHQQQRDDSYQQLMLGTVDKEEPQSAYKNGILADDQLQQNTDGSSHLITPDNERIQMVPAMNRQQDQMSDQVIHEKSSEGEGGATAVLGSREDQFMIGVISTDKIRSLDNSTSCNEDGNVFMVPSVSNDVQNTKQEVELSAIKKELRQQMLQKRSSTNMSQPRQDSIINVEDNSQIMGGGIDSQAQIVVSGNSTINLMLTRGKDANNSSQLVIRHHKSDEMLASQSTADQIQQRQDEDARRRQLELELHQRDYEILSVLGQQIKEDYMHMYNLKQDLQSDMIKIDPRYMNKAIINKIKIQNERWQQSALANATSSPLLSEQPMSERPYSGMVPRKTPTMHKRQDSGQLIEIASGLNDIQELQKYINSGAVHTRTLSQVEQSQLAWLHHTNQGKIILEMSSKDNPYLQHQVSQQQHLENIGKIPAAQGLPNTQPSSAEQTVKIDETTIQGIELTTPDKKQMLNENSFILHDNLVEGTANRREDANRDGELHSSPSNQANNVVRKNSQNNMVTFRDGENQLLEVKQTSPLSTKPEQQRVDTETTPIRRMEKLLHRFEHFAHPSHTHHREAALSMNATNQDLNIVVDDKTGFYNKNSKKSPKSPSSQMSPSSAKQRNITMMDKVYQQGATSPTWMLDYSANMMKPVKRFVNLNQQTRFADIKQSILMRNESQLSECRQSKEQRRTSVLRGKSACENSQKTTFTGRPLSPNNQNDTNNNVLLNQLASSLASRGLTLTEDEKRGIEAAGIISRNKMLLIQENQSQKDQLLRKNSVYVRVNPQQHYTNQQNYLDSELVSAAMDPQKLWRMKTAQDDLSDLISNNQGGTCSGLASGNDTQVNSKDQLVVANIRENSLRGSTELPLQTGQQKQKMMRVFDDINIAKLTSDKALNRHIHGMILPPQALQSFKLDKDRTVTRERNKTMKAQVRISKMHSATALSHGSKEITSYRESSHRGQGNTFGENNQQTNKYQQQRQMIQSTSNRYSKQSNGQSKPGMLQNSRESSMASLNQHISQATLHQYHVATPGAYNNFKLAVPGVIGNNEVIKTLSLKQL